MIQLTEPIGFRDYLKRSPEERELCGFSLLNLNKDYFQERFMETGARALLYAGSEEIGTYDSWEELLNDWSRAELRILNEGKVPYRVFQQIIVTKESLVC
jgi:hypothetical protein